MRKTKSKKVRAAQIALWKKADQRLAKAQRDWIYRAQKSAHDSWVRHRQRQNARRIRQKMQRLFRMRRYQIRTLSAYRRRQGKAYRLRRIQRQKARRAARRAWRAKNNRLRAAAFKKQKMLYKNKRYQAKEKAKRLMMAKQAGLTAGKKTKKPCAKKPKLIAKQVSIVVVHRKA